MSTVSNHVKILFEIVGEDGVGEIESLWATPLGTGYRVDSIPFYAKGVALEDLVAAEVDESGALRFMRLIEASGHSTVRLWFEREEDVSSIRETLRSFGCASELDLSRLVAVDIPPHVSYDDVRAYLEGQEAKSVFEYEEACLGQAESR